MSVERYLLLCKEKTAYERRISDWSSDVCSSDLVEFGLHRGEARQALFVRDPQCLRQPLRRIIGRADRAHNPRIDQFGKGAEHFAQRHVRVVLVREIEVDEDRKSTRLNSSH